jgi:hypothetical protein
VVLYFNGVAKAATDTQGVRFLDPAGTDYVLIYSDGTSNVIDAVNPNALRMLPTSTALNGLRLGPATSATVALGTGTPTGGMQVGSTTSGAQTGYTAYVADGVRSWAAFFGVHDNDVWGLSCNPILGGTPVFQVESAGEVLLKAAQNGSTDLYHDNVATARTKTQATGGLEVKNLETGGGFERVLTTSDVTNDVKASYQGVSGQTITSGTMTDLSGLNFTPPRAGAYRFELHLRLTADNVLVTGVDFGINVVTGTTPPASSVVWKSVNVSSDTIDNIDESTGTFLGTLATVILGDTNAHYLKATGTVRFTTTLPLIRLQAGRSGTGNVAIGPLAHMTWTYIGTP